MSGICVRYVDGDKFAVSTRGHTLTVDQPVTDGGDDTAPTPTELFVAALGACVAHYARRYLARHDLPTEGLAVSTHFTMGTRPARVEDISISIELPRGIPADRRDALLAVASHCTVHNTLENPPEVTIALNLDTVAA